MKLQPTKANPMTEKSQQALMKLLLQAHAAILDPSPRNPGKAAKLLDKAIAKLEKTA